MRKELSKLAAVIEEFRRDWPIRAVDDSLVQQFSSLLDDEELEEVLHEFIVPVQHNR
jgi:hypothetical protein